MVNGTTPTHTFTLPFDISTIKTIEIIYAQRNNALLIKKNKDIHLEGTKAIVKLTQEETFKFRHNFTVQIQLRILTTTGDALASNIYEVDCERVLNNEVLE